MLLSIIAGAIAVGGGTLFASAAHDVNQESREAINRINNDMEKMVKNAKRHQEETVNEFKSSLNNFNNIVYLIEKHTIKDFYDIAKKIKNNCEFNSNLEHLLNFDFNKISRIPDYKDNSVFSYNEVLTGAVDSILPLSAAVGVSLLFKYDDAVSEKKKLQVELKKLEIRCTEINSSSEFIKITTETLKALRNLANHLNELGNHILFQKQYDLNKLDTSEIEIIKTMFNFNIALDSLVKIQMLDKELKIRPEFKESILELESESKSYDFR